MLICNCKLCGYPGKLKTWEDYDNIEDYYYVECTNDDCIQSTEGSYNICKKDSRDKCIEEWNDINREEK